MKIVILLVILGCLFWIGYILSRKMDLFFTRNQLKTTGKAIKESQLWIGVSLKDWTLPWMMVEHLMTKEAPRARIRIGSESILMHRLVKNEADLIILRKKPTKGLVEGIRCTEVEKRELCEQSKNKKNEKVWVVWNIKEKSKNRDRILTALEDKRSVLKTGYCNY